jgi:hypothetical protein
MGNKIVEELPSQVQSFWPRKKKTESTKNPADTRKNNHLDTMIEGWKIHSSRLSACERKNY